MKHYKNILIVPFTELLQEGEGLGSHVGGPVWPNWDDELYSRHYRYGMPVDSHPFNSFNDSEVTKLNQQLYWCGPVVKHFGHQLAEFSSRLAVYAKNQDDNTKFCFGVDKKRGIVSYIGFPDFFKEVLDWFSIPPEKVTVINQPVYATDLYCIEQQEQLNDGIPSSSYLDTLDFFSQQNGVFKDNKDGVYYISRAATSTGRIAGEAYIEYVLGLSGVKVIRPEALSLKEQLRIYSLAKTLIFSEGSALHGLQILGRINCDIKVLVRRKGYRLLNKLLTPRCKSLVYYDLGNLVCGLNMNGKPAPALGITIPDSNLLYSAFSEIGIPLKFWNQHFFIEMVLQDVKLWLSEEEITERFQVDGAKQFINSKLKVAGLDSEYLGEMRSICAPSIL